jgi:DNA modification methylase
VTPAYSDHQLEVWIGDVRDVLPELPSESVDAVVTSPPYWQQRAYLPKGHDLEALELGREPTFDGWVESLVGIAEELARIMVPTGSLWINVGDRYCAFGGQADGETISRRVPSVGRGRLAGYPAGVQRKSLVLAPYRLAIALCEAGWVLRDKVVWEKTNPLPESARDRFAVVDEVVFRFTRTRFDHFDLEPARVPAKPSSLERAKRAEGRQKKLGIGAASRRGELESRAGSLVDAEANVFRYTGRGAQRSRVNPGNVWHVPTASREGALFDHFAMFPEELVVRPILTTVRPGGTVLDPFAGTGTVSRVAGMLGRRSIAIELDPRRFDDIIDRTSRRLDLALLGLGDPEAGSAGDEVGTVPAFPELVE